MIFYISLCSIRKSIMDPIANMLIQIKNAGMAGKPSVLVPYSEIKYAIAQKLIGEGYIVSTDLKEKKGKRYIEITLKYTGRTARIANVKRVSKPSRRIYMRVKDIQPVRQGYGILVLSTPKGILTDTEARKEHVGGEALFEVY